MDGERASEAWQRRAESSQGTGGGGGLVNGVEPEGVQGGFGSGVVVHGAE